MGTIVGYLVKPAARTIEVVELPSGRGPDGDSRTSLYAIYEALGVQLIDVIHLGSGVCAFVDDEGLLHDPQHFCRIASFPAPIAGNVLFVGDADDDGYTMSCPVSLEAIARRVFVYSITNADGTANTDGWQAVHEPAVGVEG